MRASVSRMKLMAVVAAAAFSTSTAAARADVMSAGTWDGQITGGTLSLGDGQLRNLTVPAGDPFTLTIPAGASAPVAFKAPAIHVAIPLISETEGDAKWSVAGSLDIAPLAGTVDPATGAVTGSSTGHGLLRLDFSIPSTPGSGSSIYCQLGDPASSADDPAPPTPFALSFAGTAGGALTDTTFAANLNCGAPFITPTTDLRIIGHPVMPSGMNELQLTTTFTRRPDATTPPPAPVTPKPTPVTPKPVTPTPKCIVPKLKGLKLAKARAAAKKAGCAVGKVKRKKSVRKRSTVLRQGLPVGAILDQGSKIRLIVAK